MKTVRAREIVVEYLLDKGWSKDDFKRKTIFSKPNKDYRYILKNRIVIKERRNEDGHWEQVAKTSILKVSWLKKAKRGKKKVYIKLVRPSLLPPNTDQRRIWDIQLVVETKISGFARKIGKLGPTRRSQGYTLYMEGRPIEFLKDREEAKHVIAQIILKSELKRYLTKTLQKELAMNYGLDHTMDSC